ncbi:MAG: hypothetical protein DMF63_13180 [Acidobacteria bacterium]|nr:MAG: hypothetical protein DMF63_13180 [Acidobacteriota bacterium]
MIHGLPAYVPVVFILTTLFTVGIFFYAIFRAGIHSSPAKFLIAFTSIWLVVQAVLASNGFFQNFDVAPPRTFAFGPLPFFVLTFVYLIFARKFLTELPLTVLTWIHIIRIPVECCLLWLSQHGLVPVEMTFEGRNLDILSGVTAPIVFVLAFRKGSLNRNLLIVWNIAALCLLTNVVTIAVLAFPSKFQMLAFDQPNIGVTYFPYVWLPSIIVPIVFFCHAASLYKLLATERHAS